VNRSNVVFGAFDGTIHGSYQSTGQQNNSALVGIARAAK